MRRLAAIIATAFLLSTASACLVRTHSPGKSGHSAKKSKSCHPSHYWDGHKCQHKGKGKKKDKH